MTDIATLIRQMARDKGYSSTIGDALVGIAHHESGHNPRALGDGGTSYGLFQLHRNGGALGSMSHAQAQRYWDPRENTAFALRAIKPYVNNGMTVEQAVDAISRKFERPANPSGEIAAALAYLRGKQTSVPFAGTPSSGGAPDAGDGADDIDQQNPALMRAVEGAKRNATMLKLPYIKLPDIGSEIPFRAQVDRNISPQQVPQPSQIGTAIVNSAKHFLGIKYTWGGTSPTTGFDCSGLMQYVYHKFGISIPRVSQDQFRGGQKVSASSARPGDLVFFARGGDVHHVGMYIGNGLFLQAPRTGDVVKISKLSDRSDIAGFRRYAKT
jgi:cell wall-associated NlpC family hydrolase